MLVLPSNSKAPKALNEFDESPENLAFSGDFFVFFSVFLPLFSGDEKSRAKYCRFTAEHGVCRTLCARYHYAAIRRGDWRQRVDGDPEALGGA